MFIRDGLTVDKTWETADGFLGFSARFAKAGIQHYLGEEIDPEGKHLTADGKRRFEAGKLYPVNRPSREVFADRAMGSFIAKPITNDHPSEGVNVNNWKDLTKGVIGEVLRDGQYARMSGLITDKATIADYRAGKKELSGGYATQLVVGDGTNEFGEYFVAEQTAIEGNHCALVKRGRAGPACAISDSIAICDANPAALADFTTPSIGDLPMKTLTIDGLKVPNVSDEAEAAIVKLQADKAAADAKITELDAKNVADAATIVAKDAEIADLKAKLADAEITPAKLADAAKEYALVQAKAKAVGVDFAADADTAAIKKAVVDAKMGEAAKDYTDDHIAIAFDALTKDAKTDAPKVQPIGAPRIATDARTGLDAARQQWLADKSNAYRATAN